MPDERVKECAGCAAKPGAARLCDACIHNRDLVIRVMTERDAARAEARGATARLHRLNDVLLSVSTWPGYASGRRAAGAAMARSAAAKATDVALGDWDGQDCDPNVIRSAVASALDAFAAGVAAERDEWKRYAESLRPGLEAVRSALAGEPEDVPGGHLIDQVAKMATRVRADRDAARATLAEVRAAWAALEASWPGWRAHADALATLRRVLGGA